MCPVEPPVWSCERWALRKRGEIPAVSSLSVGLKTNTHGEDEDEDGIFITQPHQVHFFRSVLLFVSVFSLDRTVFLFFIVR